MSRLSCLNHPDPVRWEQEVLEMPLQPKKLLILNILEILKHYTNIDHPITQKKIMEYLEQDYGMAAERKAVKRNLAELMEAGYPVRAKSEKVRGTGDDENIACSDFYYEHDFTDAELRLLIDSVLFSRSIPHRQGKELIKKLENLTDENFNYRVEHICGLPENLPQNKQLFYTIEILNEAISKKKQVELIHSSYGTDLKLHPATDENGNVKKQIINPYQIVATNGRFYLICNNDHYDNIIHYRLDRITGIKLLKTPVKPIRSLPEAKTGLNLPKHMAEHLYMFPGKTERVTFLAKKYLMNDLVDWFGTDLFISDESEEEITVSVTVNISAMRLWAMQYALHVRVLEPEILAEQIKKDIQIAVENYKKIL